MTPNRRKRVKRSGAPTRRSATNHQEWRIHPHPMDSEAMGQLAEVDRTVRANAEDARLRERVRAEVRSLPSAWGLPPVDCAELLEALARDLRERAEADARRSRGGK